MILVAILSSFAFAANAAVCLQWRRMLLHERKRAEFERHSAEFWRCQAVAVAFELDELKKRLRKEGVYR